MTPLRILQLVQKPQRRGAEVFALQLSNELRRQGHVVQVNYLYPYSGAQALGLESGDRMLGGREASLLDRLAGVHPVLLQRVARAIADFAPDIVQLNGGRTVKYGVLARSLLRAQRPLLVYRNIGDPRDWIRGARRSLFYRWLLRRVDGVVAISGGSVDHLQKVYDLRVPTAVIRNGIDERAVQPRVPRLEVRRALGAAPQTPVILFVGSLSTEKRVDRLLAALPQVRQALPDTVLWIIGDGPLRAQLQAQARALGVETAVRFLGVRTDVGSYMSAANVLGLLSDTEGIPGVLLEAGYLRLPVVATRVGGIPECVRDGETGLLVAPDDDAGVARSLAMLLQSPETGTVMGERAHAWIHAHFRMTATARGYVDFFQTVLQHQTPVPARVVAL